MKIKHLVWIRRFSQSFFFCLFIYLLFKTQLPQDVYLDYTYSFSQSQDIRLTHPVNFFWRLDPLAWLSSLLSSFKWIEGFGWAIGLILLTILVGRFFCGYICPFGTMHHFISVIKPRKKSKELILANRARPDRLIKYIILIFFLTSALLGLNISGWLDPLSFMFRSFALSIFPAIGNGLTGLQEILANSNIKILHYIGYALSYLSIPLFGYEYVAFQTGALIGGLFIFVCFLNRIRPRFFCRILCPLGALLGLCSRHTILKLEKKEKKCTHCGKCTKNCPGAASCEPGAKWLRPECFLCMNCQNLCPEDALSFKINKRLKTPAKVNIGRRALLGGLAAGISFPLLSKLDGNVNKVSNPKLIRPPGALDETEFLEKCLRCGLCMKVCPTNVINPAVLEAGLAGFWTPNLIMTQGYCEYTCTLCGSICPTGAISNISAKEKITKPIRIGSAFVDRGRCLPWSGNEPCIVCEEHCPTSPKAIYFKNDVMIKNGQKITIQLPYVDLNQCVGCGICEYKCPIKGMPAIRVISAGESRSLRNQILL